MPLEKRCAVLYNPVLNPRDCNTNRDLWGFRDGAQLCLCADPTEIPQWATVHYSFSSPGELVFGAHYVPLVRTLSGQTVEGIAFTAQDAQQQFQDSRGGA